MPTGGLKRIIHHAAAIQLLDEALLLADFALLPGGCLVVGVGSINDVALYRELLAGRISGRDVWSRLQASNRVGVTRGTLEERRNPLAII